MGYRPVSLDISVRFNIKSWVAESHILIADFIMVLFEGAPQIVGNGFENAQASLTETTIDRLLWF